MEWMANLELESAKWHAEREREHLEWMANFERESAERHREQQERGAKLAKARSRILWAIFGSYTAVGVVLCIVAVLT